MSLFTALLLLTVAWLSWRIWKFTILPILRPNDVKYLPYWIPCESFLQIKCYSWISLLNHPREYFGNTRETFVLTVAGQKLYILTSAKRILAVLKDTQIFDNGKPKAFLMRKFGISNNAINMLFEKPSPSLYGREDLQPNHQLDSMVVLSENIIKKQLVPGKVYEKFESAFLSVVEERLRWENVPFSAILSSTETERTVSLFELTRQTLVEATAIGFFGPKIVRIDPAFVENFLYFDDRTQMFLQKLPSPWKSSVEVSIEKLRRTIKTYFELPRDQRSGAAWLVDTLETELTARGVSKGDLAGWFVMLYWAMNTNTWRLGFWVSAYLLFHPDLLAAIREEILPFPEHCTTLASLHSHLANSKHFSSLYHEVLRLVDSPISIRESTRADTSLSPGPLPAKAVLMLAHRQLLMDDTVWGPEVTRFNPERFLHDEKLLRSKSYTPFGGGSLLCPGRFMARGEIMVFIALLIRRFDITVVSRCLPRIDPRSNAGVGILGAKKGDDLVLLLSKLNE
ncbi:cytochrome P450 [Thozetella sp. PMI_491]|nr:cytochrome P450 [Thozetella sp. PMI_491]